MPYNVLTFDRALFSEHFRLGSIGWHTFLGGQAQFSVPSYWVMNETGCAQFLHLTGHHDDGSGIQDLCVLA